MSATGQRAELQLRLLASWGLDAAQHGPAGVLLPPLSMDLKPTNGYGLHIVIISHVEVERSNGIAETAEPAS